MPLIVTLVYTDESTDDEQSLDDLAECDQRNESVQYDSSTLLEITRSSLLNFFEIAERLDKCPFPHSINF